jgi:gluconokinase
MISAGTVAAAGSPGGADPGLVIVIDMSTSSVKVEAVSLAAAGHGSAEPKYPTEAPHPGWSEQDPAVSAAATAEAVREMADLVTGAGRTIAGVSYSSAMHSLIGLDADGERLTPSLTWADGRAACQARRQRRSATGRPSSGDRLIADTRRVRAEHNQSGRGGESGVRRR